MNRKLEARLQKEAFKNLSRCIRLLDECESMIMVNALTKYTYVRNQIEDVLIEIEKLKTKSEYAIIKINNGLDAEE